MYLYIERVSEEITKSQQGPFMQHGPSPFSENISNLFFLCSMAMTLSPTLKLYVVLNWRELQ